MAAQQQTRHGTVVTMQLCVAVAVAAVVVAVVAVVAVAVAVVVVVVVGVGQCRGTPRAPGFVVCPRPPATDSEQNVKPCQCTNVEPP